MARPTKFQIALAVSALLLATLAVAGHAALFRTGKPLRGERTSPIPTYGIVSTRMAATAQRRFAAESVAAGAATYAVERRAPVASRLGAAAGTAEATRPSRTRTITDRNPREE